MQQRVVCMDVVQAARCLPPGRLAPWYVPAQLTASQGMLKASASSTHQPVRQHWLMLRLFRKLLWRLAPLPICSQLHALLLQPLQQLIQAQQA